MERMLVDKIENRILVGIVMFVGIMLMLGWVAINENGRMVTFQGRNDARSIENGAALFAVNCTTCHNTDGRGLQNRAPGLNNPALFGHDFFADIKTKRSDLEKEQATLTEEQTSLQTELDGGGVSDRRKTEIETRLVEITDRLGENGIPKELTDLQTEQDALLTQLTPAIDKGYDPMGGKEQNFYDRLKQANWTGSLENYVYTTLVHGRSQNAGLWGGNIMVAWSQQAGGPLRDDQVRDIVRYVLNFDKGDNWTVEDLLAVNQFAQVPGAGGGEVTGTAAGTDVDAVLAQWAAEGIVGDPTRGEALYKGSERTQLAQRLACASCHVGAINGPNFEGTWERVVTERLTLPQFAGYSPEKYVLESILVPGNYTVEGFTAGLMPANFGEITSAQDLADLVAYLHSTDPNYVPPTPAPATEDTTATEEPAATEEAPAATPAAP